jgi:hypothetical protein
MNHLQSAALRGIMPRRQRAEREVPAVDWKAQAIAIYQRRDEYAALLAELSRRVQLLTGRDVRAEYMWVDCTERTAGVTVDGVRFRLEQARLVIVRPCQYCGLGDFASPALHSQVDLGYALSAWTPRHPNCLPDETADLS